MSNIAKGAATGASTGAAIGSIVPGVGTLIGGAVGAVAGGLGGAFKDKKEKKVAEDQQLAQGTAAAARMASPDAPRTTALQDMMQAGRRARLAREMAPYGGSSFDARVRRKLTAEQKDPALRDYRDKTIDDVKFKSPDMAEGIL
jgi:hypothetical protein